MTDPKDAEIARYDLDLMESRMVKDQWGGEWVRYSDHAAEIARLTAALAESEAAAEGALMILVQTQAERDAALEQVAGAYEAAADVVSKLRDTMNLASPGDWGCEDSNLLRHIETTIRALTPANALAALSRRDAQMRAEGMRMAACIEQTPEFGDDWLGMSCAILAAAEKEAQG